MRLFLQRGQDQPLPAPLQPVFRAVGGKLQSAPPLQRLQQQMDLRIMAQGLVMAHPFHRSGDGLPVDNASGTEGDRQAKPVGDQALQYLQLDLAHKLNVDLPQRTVPDDVQLGVLLLELAQLVQGGGKIGPFLQKHLIGEHRLQLGRGRRPLRPQPLAGQRAAQSGNGAHAPRRGLLRQTVFLSGVEPDLIHLLRPHPILRQSGPPVGHQVLHPQRPARHLQPGQPPPLAVPGDLIDPRAEIRAVHGRKGIPFQHLQQRVHPLQAQRGAEVAGEKLPRAHQAGHLPV